MSTITGSASRAREMARLFDQWRRAFDAGDAKAMATARRAIDAAVAGETPRDSEARTVDK